MSYILSREGMYLPGGNYQYYLKDHLGNTRLAVNTSGQGGTVVQQTDYYPFGMDIASYNGGLDNKYRYNGKEFQEDVIGGKSLGWYDYGARFYDPQVARWHTIDPEAEQYVSWSPYNYVGGNPIKRTDKDGKIWDTFLDIAFTVYDVAEIGYQYATTGQVSATSVAALSADAIAIAIPFATGAGIATRIAAKGVEAAKVADKAVDAVKTANKVAETTKVADKAADAQKLEKRAEKLNQTDRSGKDFTPAGKDVVKQQNTAKNAGEMKCEGCDKTVQNAQQHTKGNTPPGNEAHVDHIDPKSNAGSGTPNNGQVLCRDCNLEKSNKLPGE